MPLLTAFLVLLIGDFIATFLYHVPEHVFGKLHAVVHHSPQRSFIRYAVLNRHPIALVSGFLGAFPYLVIIPLLWQLSPMGLVLGLVLAELHVIWRHCFSRPTPMWLQVACRYLFVTTPERHWLHHSNANLAYGDVFTFYDKPAQTWLKMLRHWRRRYRLRRA
ncbi:MAG: sterol desaturase family protein [Cyanobacteria bacterium P01_A01_bin.123]